MALGSRQLGAASCIRDDGPTTSRSKRRQLATASDRQAKIQKLCKLRVAGYILVGYCRNAALWSAWVSGQGSAVEHMGRFEVAVMEEVTTRKDIHPHIEKKKVAMGGRSVGACVAAG